MGQSQANGHEAKFHCFNVHHRSAKKQLDARKNYTSVDDIKRDAVSLFTSEELSDRSAILTCYDVEKNQVLLTTVPALLKEGQYRDLFIESVRISFFCQSNWKDAECIFR